MVETSTTYGLTVAIGCPIGLSMMLSISVPMENAIETTMPVKTMHDVTTGESHGPGRIKG